MVLSTQRKEIAVWLSRLGESGPSVLGTPSSLAGPWGQYVIERERSEGGVAHRARAIYDRSLKEWSWIFRGVHLDPRGDLK